MSLRNEVAALMASEGEYEKKISLLKKAVVSVTKQKQELEARVDATQEELRVARQDLSSAREENLKLHRRITTLESELDQERKKGTNNFGQNFMKGLSSLVAGGEDGSGAPGVGVPAAGKGKRGGGSEGGRQQLALSPEDVEKVVKENESLLMQVYAMKTKYDEKKAKAKEASEKAKIELEAAAREAADQRSLLDATTHACDELNALCAKQRAMVSFCQRFFSLQAKRTETGITYAIGSSPPFPSSQQANEAAETHGPTSVMMLEESSVHFITLLDAVSVLLSTLREVLPKAQRATIGDLRVFADRLATLQEAHGLAKVSLLHHLKGIQDAVCTEAAPCDVAHFAQSLTDNGTELISEVLSWLRLLRSHMPLLVDCCVASLPSDQSYRLASAVPEIMRGNDSGTTGGLEVSERETFVEEVVALFNTFLSDVEGSLEALQGLLTASSAAVAPSLASTTTEESSVAPAQLASADLCPLLQFWWHGSQAAPALCWSATQLGSLIRDVADACHSSLVKDTLRYISTRVAAFGVPLTLPTDGRAPKAALLSLLSPQPPRQPTPTMGSGGGGGGKSGPSVLTLAAAAAPWQGFAQAQGTSGNTVPDGSVRALNQEDLLHALAAADRAAVTYWTQMNATVLELAEKEDLLEDLRDALQVAQAQLTESRVEAEHARCAFQEKIRLLSDQLIELTSNGTRPATSAGNAGSTRRQ